MEKDNKMKKAIIYNFLIDQKKKQLNNFDRAELIKEYIEANKLSIRKLGEELNIHHNTLQDWLLWNRISREKYDHFISIGYTDTEIYRFLRENRFHKKEEVENTDPLSNRVERLNGFILKNKTRFTSEHVDILKNVINACNYALYNIEK